MKARCSFDAHTLPNGLASSTSGSASLTGSKFFAAHTLPDGLATHQVEAIAWIKERPVALLAHATGAGKTAVAAAVIGDAFEWEGAQRALWVTEAGLIQQTLEQLDRFLPELTASQWPGRVDDPIRVISVEILTRRAGDVTGWGAQVVVHDEITSMKGQGVEPQAVKQVMGVAQRRLGLTATPVELDATEAYRMLRVLNAELPPEHVFDRYVEWQDLPFGEQRPGGTLPEYVHMVREVFSGFILRRNADQVGLLLPALDEQSLWVKLTPPQARAYEHAKDHKNPMVVASRRDKACMYAGGRSAKAEAAAEWLLAHPEITKAVIFAEHRRHLDILERHLIQAGVGFRRLDGPCTRRQRASAVEAFRDYPDVRVLIGTKALERGLDGLQHCAVLITLDSSFNPAREAQRIGRIRRPGSPHKQVLHLTFRADTHHEEAKQERLTLRSSEAARLLDDLPLTNSTPFDPRWPTTHSTREERIEMTRTEFRFVEHVMFDLDYDTIESRDAALAVEDSSRVMADEVCIAVCVPRGSTFAAGAAELLAYQDENWPDLMHAV